MDLRGLVKEMPEQVAPAVADAGPAAGGSKREKLHAWRCPRHPPSKTRSDLAPGMVGTPPTPLCLDSGQNRPRALALGWRLPLAVAR